MCICWVRRTSTGRFLPCQGPPCPYVRCVGTAFSMGTGPTVVFLTAIFVFQNVGWRARAPVAVESGLGLCKFALLLFTTVCCHPIWASFEVDGGWCSVHISLVLAAKHRLVVRKHGFVTHQAPVRKIQQSLSFCCKLRNCLLCYPELFLVSIHQMA